jgi:GDP-L-fucose synthase
LLRSHRELDLTDAGAVRPFFSEHRPQYVFLAAAKVGGIWANQKFPAEFIFENLKIQTNLIHACWQGGGVERVIFLGSSCIYPKFAPQPLREEYWFTGPLEPTNRAYAVAKIAGVEMGWAYNRQYGCRFLAAMPTNLYGAGDHYDSQTSHLIPALIRKMHQARITGAPEVLLWGSGEPRRELLYSDDAADACIFLMNLPQASFELLAASAETAPLINVGSGGDFTVREIAEVVAKVVGVSPTLRFDATMPDGTPRKLLDVGRLSALGWSPSTDLPEGLGKTYADFCARWSESSVPASGPEKPVTQCVS